MDLAVPVLEAVHSWVSNPDGPAYCYQSEFINFIEEKRRENYKTVNFNDAKAI
jgi:hypothetical protein